MFCITSNTIAEAWENSIRLLLEAQELYSYDSDRGFCLELESVVLHVSEPLLEPQVSDKYIFPQLVDEYCAKIAGKTPEARTAYERIHQWVKRDGKKLNQYAAVLRHLKINPDSRAAVVSIWDPEVDLFSTRPLSPCLVYFSIRHNALNSAILARSSDAWVNALPEMIGFCSVQKRLANSLGIGVGRLSFHALSYHIYEYDLPIALNLFGSEALVNG